MSKTKNLASKIALFCKNNARFLTLCINRIEMTINFLRL